MKTPAQQLLEFAQQEATSAATGITLHNAVYGVGGKFAELFPTQRARTLFAESDEFKTINGLIDGLGGYTGEAGAPSGKFNLRVPVSMHAALIREAESEGVSLNQLCVAKLALDLGASIAAGS